METIIHWLESHMMPCFYQKYFGIACPGCGFQRSLIALLKGNLSESWHLYPPLLPILLMTGLLLLHLVFKFKHGAVVLKYLFMLISGIIAGNYLLRLFAA